MSHNTIKKYYLLCRAKNKIKGHPLSGLSESVVKQTYTDTEFKMLLKQDITINETVIGGQDDSIVVYHYY